MKTIEDQMALENKMIGDGIGKAIAQTKEAEKAGRASETAYGDRLIKKFLSTISDAIKERFLDDTKIRRNGKMRTVVRASDPDALAYMTLMNVFDSFEESKPHSVTSVAANIGRTIEDDLRFKAFRDNDSAYYDAILKDFKRKHVKSYRHKKRVLAFKANERNFHWDPWSQEDKVRLGLELIQIVRECTDLLEVLPQSRAGLKKKPNILVPSAETKAWAIKYTLYVGGLHPQRQPCVVQPMPWTSSTSGGYYSPKLQFNTPLVKAHEQAHKDLLSSDLGVVLTAVNALQNTEWEVNEEVLNILKEVWNNNLELGLPRSTPYDIPVCPLGANDKSDSLSGQKLEDFEVWKLEASTIHGMESERVGKCFQVSRILRLANDFKEGPLWFVYQCDFRGRMYTTCTGFSPQGPDYGKAVLRFRNGKPLGKRGSYWLKVHGANVYGVDKVSFDERVLWTEQNSNAILAVANDPLSNKAFWEVADKPWQFLAFCFEYARYIKEGTQMLSKLPVGMDGSCNGLQNFSALLRDPVGSKATNLQPSDKPADIYAEVAEKCTELLKSQTDDLAVMWMSYANVVHGGKLPRSVAKRPVMTLPYGATRESCTKYIYQFIIEEAGTYFPKTLRFKLALYLTPFLWSAMGATVVAAREAMDWLRHAASESAKKNKPLVWWSPTGFPVYQARYKQRSKRIAVLDKTVYISVMENTGELCGNKQRAASSPNFVHSLDAAHAMFTIDAAASEGCTAFAFIHDDFGTHACDTDTLRRVLREQFVQMYEQSTPLLELKRTVETLYNVPLKDCPIEKSFNIKQVLDSQYFFA